MISKRRPASRMALSALLVLPMLASCGLRGGLTRPDPIFTPAAEAVEAELAPEAQVESIRESVIIRRRTNEFGGEIPDPAPTAPVDSAPLTESVAPDDEDE